MWHCFVAGVFHRQDTYIDNISCLLQQQRIIIVFLSGGTLGKNNCGLFIIVLVPFFLFWGGVFLFACMIAVIVMIHIQMVYDHDLFPNGL